VREGAEKGEEEKKKKKKGGRRRKLASWLKCT